jgi:putative molybdopterin biosynthesis protein
MADGRDDAGKYQRHVYLMMSTVEEARQRLAAALANLSVCPTEWVSATQALGRVTASPVHAAASTPHYCAAAMDGFAVQSGLTAQATEAHPVRLPVPEAARPVSTGELMPEGFDAVVMIEDVHQPTGDAIEIMGAASAWQHVRLLGEDMVATELIVTQGRRLTPADVGALVACQVLEVPVVRRPRVVFLPTGGEVIGPGEPAKPGDVIDYNSHMLSGLVQEWGGSATTLPPTPDDPEALARVIARAVAENDLVAVIAGSSAGTHDFVPSLIEELGDLLCHGVRLAPGKPTALGVIDGTPVIGVPGYSVAAWMAFDLFAKPIVARLQGLAEPKRLTVTARVRRKTSSKSGTREYLRVRLGRVGEDLVAVPLKRGAGAISSLVQAEGLAIVPDMDEGLDPDTEVRVELLASADEVERTVLVVGSHDLALDLLASHLAAEPEGVRLASAHVGSLGGLRALAQREAHLAGTHLLDPPTGEYNVPYIRRVLPGLPLKLVNLAYREVGLMVLPGNPKAIGAIADLARDDVLLINRQRGAGTRVLLDDLLQSAGLAPDQIAGYDREVTTHTMVAAAISGGAADAGLGIRAAATAMGLDFVPLTSERYDLAIPEEHLRHPGVQAILSAVSTATFRDAVLDLGGYDLRDSGKVVHEQ